MHISYLVQQLHQDPTFVPTNHEFVNHYFNELDFYSFDSGKQKTHYIFSPEMAERILSSSNFLPSLPYEIVSNCSEEIISFVYKFPVFSSSSTHRRYRRFVSKSYLKQSHLICEDLAHAYLAESLSNINSGDMVHEKLSRVTLLINSKILNLHPIVSNLFTLLTPQFAAAFKNFPFDFSNISNDIVRTLKSEAQLLIDNDEKISIIDQSIEALFFTFFSGADTLTSLFEIFLFLRSNPCYLPCVFSRDEEFVDYIIRNYPYFRFISRKVQINSGLGELILNLSDNVLIPVQVVNCLMARQMNRHLTFGFGEYSCIGKYVSPIVLKVFVKLVNEHYPNLSLKSSGFANHPVLTFMNNPYVR